MLNTGFKTENDTLRKLLGNGCFYQVSRFQRDYSWDLEQWEDLWADIKLVLLDPEETSHYMGYLVLQSADDKVFTIIDGQQRLTSLSLLILACLKHLKNLAEGGFDSENNLQRAAQLRQTYIGYLDPVTLISHTKLSLNSNNDGYFKNYLVPLTHLPQRNLRSSEHLLRKSFEFFFNSIAVYLKDYPVDKQGKEIASLVEQVCDRLFFTVITVNDELNAYRVFETLNSPSVQLSSTDLLKNYLFYVLDQSDNEYELKTLEERWDQIVSRLQDEKFPSFLRAHWNSRHKFSRHVDLFKNLRKNISSPKEVFSLLRKMEEDLDNYLGLIDPESSALSMQESKELGELKLFGVRQPYPLLLAAKRKFSNEDFFKLLRIIKVISFRYNVIGGYSPSDLERVYNQTAQNLSDGKLVSLSQVVNALAPIYIDDKRFNNDFLVKVINTNSSRSRKLVRYILCALEHYAGGAELDFRSESYNIEHILPQQAQDGWGGLNFDQIQALTYRLGNMTLLDNADNRTLGNKSYAEKKPVLAKSIFVCTKKVAEDYKEEWNDDSIASRQQWMANQAKTIWKVAQFDGKD